MLTWVWDKEKIACGTKKMKHEKEWNKKSTRSQLSTKIRMRIVFLKNEPLKTSKETGFSAGSKEEEAQQR